MRFAVRMPGQVAGVALVVGLFGLQSVSPPKRRRRRLFSKDVAPIIYAKCAECHRSSGMAPMSLMTYRGRPPVGARGEAEDGVARDAALGRRPQIGKCANDPSLTPTELETIAAWVDGGAPEGNKADLPQGAAVRRGMDDWQAGSRLQDAGAVQVPADGTVPYTYITIPTNFSEDVWIRGVELRPTDRRVVHHIISDLVEGNGQPVDSRRA